VLFDAQAPIAERTRDRARRGLDDRRARHHDRSLGAAAGREARELVAIAREIGLPSLLDASCVRARGAFFDMDSQVTVSASASATLTLLVLSRAAAATHL